MVQTKEYDIIKAPAGVPKVIGIKVDSKEGDGEVSLSQIPIIS